MGDPTMSSSDPMATDKETPPPTAEVMEDYMKNFFTKLFAASIALLLILGMMYWGVDVILKDKIVTVFKTGYENAWSTEPMIQDGTDYKENPEYFWAKFRKIIIQCQFGIFFLLWIVVTMASLTTLSMFKLNIPSSKMIWITLACYLAVVFPIFLLLSYTDIFGKILENTLGYSWVNIEYGGVSLKDIMNKILSNKNDSLAKLPYSFSFLITMMDMANFCESIKKLKGEAPVGELNDTMLEFYIKNIDGAKGDGANSLTQDDLNYNYEELLKKVITKHVVGEFVWVYFGAVITMLISLSSVL